MPTRIAQHTALLRGALYLVRRYGPWLTALMIAGVVWVITNITVEILYATRDVHLTQRPFGGVLPWIMPLLIATPFAHVLLKGLQQLGQAEDELAHRDTQFRALVNGSLQGVCIHRNLHPIFANPAFARTFGFDSPDEVLTLASLLVLFAPEERAVIEQNVARRMRNEIADTQFERRALRRDGSSFWVETLATRVNWEGRAAVQLTVIDISERKSIEDMKNDFISTVSHELRTPLTSISGSLGLITAGMAGRIPPEAANLIQIAANNSDRLVRLINDILDIEKIESGKMEIEFFPIQSWQLVEMAVEGNRGFAERFGISMEIVESELDARVLGGIDQLMQVFANLISNAIKFSPLRGRIEIAARRHGDGWVRFSVRDFGQGIPEDFRSQIFEKFTQGPNGDRPRQGGTGLGLAICKVLVEKHQGRIGFESEPGHGTTFWFDLGEYRPEDATAPTRALNDRGRGDAA